MTPLRNLKRSHVIKAFQSLGFELDERRGKGSHAYLIHVEDESRVTSVPRRDPVAAGTLANMLRQAKVSRAEFIRALGR
ncbi:MAG: type II toxin-antitoxin system HicA family toxin [Planctomycetota bacterium]